MKKLLSFIIGCLLSTTGWSQQKLGIDTDTPEALLHIAETGTNTDGILFPTVNEFSTTTPTSEQNAMLVFLNRSATDSGFEGLYFWDAEAQQWQYIFQSKMLDQNLFKTIVQATNLSAVSIPTSSTYDNLWVKHTFNTIEAPSPLMTLDNGDLIIGKTGNYSVFFTGAVKKLEGSTNATQTEVGLFVDSSATPLFLSQIPLPSADRGDRSMSHTISGIAYFEKGQRISLKIRRTNSSATAVSPSSTHTLILSFLD